MTTPDHEARRQETEQLLHKALHQHAQRVEPSPDAFFKINQRIARKEERLKLPAMLRVRLQPSMVASIVLLIALTVVTTLLLTRDDNPSQPVDVASTPSSTAPEPQENPPVSQPANPATDPARGEPGEQSRPSEPGSQPNSGNQGETGSGASDGAEAGSGGDPGGQVVTSTSPDNTPDTTSEPTSPPATAPAPTTTVEEPPATDPPPPSELSYAIRPLQVASKGQVIVYKDHDTSSEQLGVIPVSSGADDYLATGIRATDYNGNHWSEVRLPTGETGWVGLETVAIVPSALSEADEGSMIAAGYQLLGVVAANEIAAEDASEANIFLPNTSLNVSSRGVYVASVFGPGAVYGRYSPSEFLEAFGAEEAAANQPSIASLYSQLACLAGNADVVSGSVSDIAPPAAMQVLPYVAITSPEPGNACRVLVYFDYLRGQAEIIGFSVHN